MIPVRESATGFDPLSGNPTLDSLDGATRAPLATILHESWTAQDRALFGVYLAIPFVTPEGKVRTGSERFERSNGDVRQVFDVADPPPPSAEDLRQASFAVEPDRADLFDRMQTATPAQIGTWIDNNVTNLAQARAVLKAIVKLLVAVQLR